MSETITLPKSGVVLTRVVDFDYLREIAPGVRARVFCCDKEVCWQAWIGDDNFHAPGRSTRDECIAWLDARVLALRAALLPADARERVEAAVLRDLSNRTRWWNSVDDDVQLEIVRELSDAVLSALGARADGGR